MASTLPSKVWVPIITSIGILVSILIGYIVWSGVREAVVFLPDEVKKEVEEGVPELKTETMVEGLSHVWDVAFAPDGTMYFDERSGEISVLAGGKRRVLMRPEDVVSIGGEGGMTGMTLDPDFANNRYMYTCFNTAQDVRLVRWKVNADNTELTDRKDIINGIPTRDARGRHSGCRPRFGVDSYLWLGTGDAADEDNPQDPKSLGGKILRVDRDGKAAPDNLGDPFDDRIYSYGHRNLQGIAFYPRPQAGVLGYSVEHGPTRDDEVNELRRGNFGWAPGSGYNENVPMTDTSKFPDAVGAAWSSGSPTIAPSGMTILTGSGWKSWNGAIAMAVLKGQHVRILDFDRDGKVTTEEEILKGFGRIRSVVIGPDNALFITTDNGDGEDKIIRVTPE